MNVEDLKEFIDDLRSTLFDNELIKFETIIDRLESYELAYDVLLARAERLEKEIEEYCTIYE
jgi:hypothetical protein